MSKFKIGDKVMLSPDSRWVDYASHKYDSDNPLNVVGVIDEADIYHHMEYGIMWDNGKHNSCYTDADLILVYETQEEYPYAVIEELECKLESFEELITQQAKQIRELEEVLNNFSRLTNYFSTKGWGNLPKVQFGDCVVEGILDYFKEPKEYLTDSHKQQIECYYELSRALSNYKYYEESEDTYAQEMLMNIRKLQNAHTALMAVMNGGK